MSRQALWRGPWDPPSRHAAIFGALLALIPLFLVALLSGDTNRDAALRFWLQCVVVTACVAGSTQLVYLVLDSVLPDRRLHGVPRFGAHVVAVLVGASLGSVLAAAVLAPLLGISMLQMLGPLFRINLAISVVVVSGLVSWDAWQGKVVDAQARELEARRTAIEAELKVLQARVNPHFLFNSLNTIAAHIHDDPDRAEDVLERMSALFRYALSGVGEDSVGLQAEVDAVVDYLEVQKARFGERLAWQIDVDPQVAGTRVPPFILHPLVDNAVTHGIAPKAGGGTVVVHATRDGTDLLLVVSDDGVGPGGSDHEGTGTALSDLGQRLQIRYGERGSLVHGAGADGGWRVTVRMPIEEL